MKIHNKEYRIIKKVYGDGQVTKLTILSSKEPEDAYKSRITDFVEDFIPGILNEEKDIREKEKMIAQLKKELNELKSKKRLWEIN